MQTKKKKKFFALDFLATWLHYLISQDHSEHYFHHIPGPLCSVQNCTLSNSCASQRATKDIYKILSILAKVQILSPEMEWKCWEKNEKNWYFTFVECYLLETHRRLLDFNTKLSWAPRSDQNPLLHMLTVAMLAGLISLIAAHKHTLGLSQSIRHRQITITNLVKV